jgi:hypothetical protein
MLFDSVDGVAVEVHVEVRAVQLALRIHHRRSVFHVSRSSLPRKQAEGAGWAAAPAALASKWHQMERDLR